MLSPAIGWSTDPSGRVKEKENQPWEIEDRWRIGFLAPQGQVHQGSSIRGWLTSSWSRKAVTSGECVSIAPTSTKLAQGPFPITNIDRLVDSSSAFWVFSFLDTSFGYNQIPLYLGDGEKTSFITDKTTYCYKVVSFGLKNAGGDLPMYDTQSVLGEARQVHWGLHRHNSQDMWLRHASTTLDLTQWSAFLAFWPIGS